MTVLTVLVVLSEPQGCHLPGDGRVESNHYICKEMLLKTFFTQIIHAREKNTKVTGIYGNKQVPHLSLVCPSHNASPKSRPLLLIS